MYTTSNEEVGMWTSVNPLRLQLVCQQLRCPYDLPLEKKHHRRRMNPSWFSSLLSGSHTSSAEKIDIIPHTNMALVNIEETKKESSQDEVSTMISPPIPANTVQEREEEYREEEGSNMIPLQPIYNEEKESELLKGNSNKDMRSSVRNSPVQIGRVSLSSDEINKSPLVRSPRENRESKHDILENDHRTCGVDVDTDNDDNNDDNNNNNKENKENDKFEDDKIVNIHSSSSNNIESNTFEKLLSDTVERLYTKLQGTALKVVAVDDLNQQLLEKIHPIELDNTVNDKTEMALHLYSLKRQVEILKKTWDEQEFHYLASEDHSVKRRSESSKPSRVEIIRAYEEPPVPYKKPPFTPVDYKRKSIRSHDVISSPSSTENRSSNSSYRTSSHSTLLSSKTKTSSYDRSYSTSYISSVATYSDDFEDE